MSIELKIKSKHLGLEAKVIRFEENKLKRQILWCKNRQDDTALRSTWHSLNHHRRWDVRNENRATFLARAYIAGKPYKSVEAKADETFVRFYILPRVVSMVMKYGTPRQAKVWNCDTKRMEYPKEVENKVREEIKEWLSR